MMIDCPAMEPYRKECDLGPFIKLYRTLKPQFSSVIVLGLAMIRKEENSNRSQYLLLSMFTEIYIQIMDYSMINKVYTHKVLRDSFRSVHFSQLAVI